MEAADVAVPARRPKYLKLAEQIRSQIESGQRRPGEQLPSFAQMQARHNLSQSTLEKMYRVLEAQKLIVREPGRGIYVASQDRVSVGVIGLLAHHAMESHPYYSQVLAGMRTACRSQGYEVLLLNDVSSLSWEKIDGVVLCFGYMKGQLGLLPVGMPRVSILYPVEETTVVGIDDYEGLSGAVTHLLEHGHRRIGYLTVGSARGSDPLSIRRLQAYHETMGAHGIETRSEWVQSLQGPYDTVRRFTEMGHYRMKEWLASGWHELGLTALLVQNDDAAIGVIEALQEAGLKVPDDVSVVGFDGTEIAEYFRPRLTTVQVPLRELGELGTQLLLRQLKRPFAEVSLNVDQAQPVLLPARLRLGQSSGPVIATRGPRVL